MKSVFSEGNCLSVDALKTSEDDELKELIESGGLSLAFHKECDKQKPSFSAHQLFVFGDEMAAVEISKALAKTVKRLLGSVQKELSQNIVENI